jgi:glycosyltransferase involved in cell wall biosynthesis
MKILILANSDGGLFHFRKDLIRGLINLGNEIYISVPFGSHIESMQRMGCNFIETNVDRRGINPITDLKLILFYMGIINKIKPNLVISYTIKPNIYGGIVSKICRVKYALNITGLGTTFQKNSLIKRMVINLYKLSCSKAKVIFFENEANKQLFVQNNIANENKTFTLNGAGVNLEEYKFIEYPEKKENLHFLFIGRLMKEKGINELSVAAEKIKKEYNNVIFDIVGSFEDDYNEKVCTLQNNGIIEYHGYQSDVRPFIKKSCCLILPSYHEGMSNVLLEAASSGRPLITSNIHGCLEAVEDGINGYLVNVKDNNDLYIKIKQFIQLPHEKKVEMGKRSRDLMVKTFDKKKVVETTIKKILG